MQASGLYLPEHLESCTYEMQSHAHSINASTAPAPFGGLFGDIGEPGWGTGGSVDGLGCVSVTVPMGLGKRPRPAEPGLLEADAGTSSAEQVETLPPFSFSLQEFCTPTEATAFIPAVCNAKHGPASAGMLSHGSPKQSRGVVAEHSQRFSERTLHE